KQSFLPILVLEDMIKLKLEGDSCNIGQKQNYVIVTVCLLNEGKK
ncbi:2220_t:CDS:1, partial [Cetraspora pellucida]